MNENFVRGDVIEWCNDKYIVLENHGSKGDVVEFTKNVTPEYLRRERFSFWWTWQGDKSVKVGHVDLPE